MARITVSDLQRMADYLTATTVHEVRLVRSNGGWKFVAIDPDTGAERSIITPVFLPARECYNLAQAFCRGYESAKYLR